MDFIWDIIRSIRILVLSILKMIVNFDKVVRNILLLVGAIEIYRGEYVAAAFFIPAGLVAGFGLGKLKGFVLEQIEKLQQKRNNN